MQLDEPQKGREFEKLRTKTDKQRLAFVVQRIFSIQNSWKALVTQGTIPVKHFDEDSCKQVQHYKNYLPFESVFRLIPDILVKGFKLVELSKIWYNCARRLEGAAPAVFQTATDFFQQIELCEQRITALTKNMEYKRELRITKNSERRLLLNQILRFDEIKEKYDYCVDKERELKAYYKQLKSERNAEYPKLDKLSRHDTHYKESYDQIQYLAEAMKGVYRELQTASYELELVKQDYTVEMSNRTNLIHMQSDVKSIIQEIDESLPLDDENRLKSCHSCEKLRANVSRMWTALYRSKADEELAARADQILQCKYSQPLPINSRSNTVAINSPQHNDSSEDTTDLEQALDSTLTSEMGQDDNFDREKTGPSDMTTSPEAPLPPLPPPLKEGEKVETAGRRVSSLSAGYNPSTAGLVDQHEAKEYRERVDRLKKKFELDLSGLKTTVDCKVELPVIKSAPVQVAVKGAGVAVESGDEADMDSDQEDGTLSRPQSKRLTKRNPDRYSPLSDASDDYIYQQRVHAPGQCCTTHWLIIKTLYFTDQFTLCTN